MNKPVNLFVEPKARSRYRLMLDELRRQRRGWVVDGAKSVNLFNDLDTTCDRISSGGIESDWLKVGADIRAAIAAEKLSRERNAG